ncbi:MAG: hypothetical protein AB2989_00435 [Candidatus Symbiodolus clandestinus]
MLWKNFELFWNKINNKDCNKKKKKIINKPFLKNKKNKKFKKYVKYLFNFILFHLKKRNIAERNNKRNNKIHQIKNPSCHFSKIPESRDNKSSCSNDFEQEIKLNSISCRKMKHVLPIQLEKNLYQASSNFHIKQFIKVSEKIFLSLSQNRELLLLSSHNTLKNEFKKKLDKVEHSQKNKTLMLIYNNLFNKKDNFFEMEQPRTYFFYSTEILNTLAPLFDPTNNKLVNCGEEYSLQESNSSREMGHEPRGEIENELRCEMCLAPFYEGDTTCNDCHKDDDDDSKLLEVSRRLKTVYPYYDFNSTHNQRRNSDESPRMVWTPPPNDKVGW